MRARIHPARWMARCGLVLGMLAAPVAGVAAPASGGGPVRDLNRPLVVGASEVFYPYSFRDDDGQLRGFAVDVTDAVARQMNLSFERVVLSNTAMGEALRAGRIDVVQFWAETPARRPWADFSVPIVTFETIVVIREGDPRVRRPQDLAGLRVAVGQTGTVGERYLLESHPAATPVYTETTEQLLRLVSAGECDAAVMSRLTAAAMIERLRLRNLRILEARVPGDAYDVRYCFTVRHGDSLLLARLNEGLAILHRTGEFDRIHQQWFGRYETRRFSRTELLAWVAGALSLGFGVAVWGVLRQRSLLRRIGRQATELAEQRSLLAALHEKHPLATAVFELPAGAPGVLVSVNPEAARLLRLDPLAPLGVPVERLPLEPAWRELIEAALTRAAGRDQPESWEQHLAAAQRIIECTVVPLGPGGTARQRVCVLFNDITHRRHADEELAQSRRLRALGELAGGVAHEFNNLLTPILGTANLLRNERRGDDALLADLGVIDQSARRAADLTRRLLSFGRRGAGGGDAVPLAETVRNCFAMLQPTADRRLGWQADIPTDLPAPAVGADLLGQVLFDLVINARDTLLARLARESDPAWAPVLRVSAALLPAPAHRSRHSVGPHVIEGWIRLTVQDNGEGIPPERLPRIFEPMYSTKESGAGLGLSTVWHAVTSAGGDVLVDSRPGEGTRIDLMLPHWRSEAAAPAAAVAAAPAAGGCRILLAEDEPMVARTTTAMLRRLGHAAEHVADGAAAWERLERHTSDFDTLLLDINMPRLSGVDLVRRIRGTDYTGRIIMMSGRVAEEDIAALRALEVDCILPKPFLPEDLKAALAGGSHPPVGG